MFIDTHAHLICPEYKSDLPKVIARAKEAKLQAIINVALLEDKDQFEASMALAEEHPGFVFNTVGVHPHDASLWQEGTYERLKQLARHKSVVAIGETGLDYHYMHSPKEVQHKVFRELLSLSQELDLAAVIHTREAPEDTLKILKEEDKGKLKGVFHCYSGDNDFAKKVLDMGFLISFTGIITFPKANNVRSIVKEIPLDRIMIETDCPYLSPQEFRGKRNEPAYVVRVAEKIAEVKKISIEEVAKATTRNARELFRLKI